MPTKNKVSSQVILIVILFVFIFHILPWFFYVVYYQNPYWQIILILQTFASILFSTIFLYILSRLTKLKIVNKQKSVSEWVRIILGGLLLVVLGIGSLFNTKNLVITLVTGPSYYYGKCNLVWPVTNIKINNFDLILTDKNNELVVIP